MFYNDFGDFLNNPPSFGSNSVFQKTSFLVFRAFRELRDSKKVQAKEHVQNFRDERNGLKMKTRSPTSWKLEGPTQSDSLAA